VAKAKSIFISPLLPAWKVMLRQPFLRRPMTALAADAVFKRKARSMQVRFGVGAVTAQAKALFRRGLGACALQIGDNLAGAADREDLKGAGMGIVVDPRRVFASEAAFRAISMMARRGGTGTDAVQSCRHVGSPLRFGGK